MLLNKKPLILLNSDLGFNVAFLGLWTCFNEESIQWLQLHHIDQDAGIRISFV